MMVLLVIILLGISGSFKASVSGLESVGCPLACPDGWVRFGFSENCYKLPPQPVVLDTFWNHQHRCKEIEPTSYVAVINTITEQNLLTSISMGYFPMWFSNTSADNFFWLGGYTDQKGWIFLDGTNQTGNILLRISVSVAAGSQRNDTCLIADSLTMGLWRARPCSDKKGIAICEMPRRHLCGKTGGILPVSPASVRLLPNIFPDFRKVPFYPEIMEESDLDNALIGAGYETSNTCWLGNKCSKAIPGQTPAGCRYDCPPGWIFWGHAPDAYCYLLPNADKPDVDSFWSMQVKCENMDSLARVVMIRGLLEQAMMTAIAKHYVPKWNQQHPDAFLWLGGYTQNDGWHFPDGIDNGVNLPLSMANLPERTPGSFRNGSCLAANLTSAGQWFTVPCDRKTGLAICQMPKRMICGGEPGGAIVNVLSFAEELSAQTMLQLFPHSPNVPFLADVFDGKSLGTFDPVQAMKNLKAGRVMGDAVVGIVCVRKRNNATLENIPMHIGVAQYSATGQWHQIKCKIGPVNVFKIQPITYTALWSFCYNKGYEVVMPNPHETIVGWLPFQVGDIIVDHYRQVGKDSFQKIASVSSKEC